MDAARQKKVELQATAILYVARQEAASQKHKVQKPARHQEPPVQVHHLIQKPYLATTQESQIHDIPWFLPNPEGLLSQKPAMQHPKLKPAGSERRGNRKPDLPEKMPTQQVYSISRQALPLAQQPHVGLPG